MGNTRNRNWGGGSLRSLHTDGVGERRINPDDNGAKGYSAGKKSI
jgi:hypothetical protein